MANDSFIIGPPPFHANPDGKSCGQCCWRMALEHFSPSGNWDFPVMDRLCGAEPGKYTWVFRPTYELARLGLNLTVYDTFDPAPFIANPKGYLAEKFGQAGMEDNVSHSNMDSVVNDARMFLQEQKNGLPLTHNLRYYTPEDMREELRAGHLLFTWVNSAKLNGRDGYTGHYILVYGYEDGVFLAHDPGGSSPPVPGRRIAAQDLIAAASPLTPGNVAEMVAIGAPQPL